MVWCLRYEGQQKSFGVEVVTPIIVITSEDESNGFIATFS